MCSPPGLFRMAAIGSLRRYSATRALTPETVARRNYYSLLARIFRSDDGPALSCCFPTELVAYSCGNPTGLYERQKRRLAGHACLDGPQNAGGHGAAARLRDRAKDRADQRRPAGGESRHALPGLAQARAGRLDLIEMGSIGEQPQSEVLHPH